MWGAVDKLYNWGRGPGYQVIQEQGGDMGELDNRLKELLRRTKITTKSRYRASERLERHHKLSQWTVSLISAALVFVPLAQAFKITIGVEEPYLNATQAILAVLVLVSGKGADVPDDDYSALSEEY